MKRTILFLLLITNVYSAFAQSDNCSFATLINVNATCVYTAGTSAGATQNIPGCKGNADDDVWYKFVANNNQQIITVDPSANYDPVVQLFSGSCAALVSLACQDNGFMGDQEQITATGLTVGDTYYIRVYHYWAGSGSSTFNICVQGYNISSVTNDDPCSAIDLGTVTSECNYQHFTTTGATTSAPAVAAGCTNSGDAKGGFGAGTKDVWFKVVVPASGSIAITQQPGYGTIPDGAAALYTGACGALTQVACDDDGGPNCSTNCLSPSGNNMPVITKTGLAAGSTVYIRFWAYGTVNSGDFGICVTTATNDNCGTSLYICDLNGYKATTSPLYSVDRPSNMSGTSNGTVPGYPAEPHGYVNSGNKGGPFGLNSCDTGDYRRVTIDNNSWITFTAAGNNASLDVTVGDCYKNRGVQFQVFKVTAPCTNFDTVSGIYQNYYLNRDNAKPWCTSLPTSTFIPMFTVVCHNLVPGQKYYLMVDGFAGDICNYSISAKTGVQAAPVINQTPNTTLCRGDSVRLTFNKKLTGAFNFYYTGPAGDTISTPAVDTAIWVKPLTTTTYGLVIESVCGNKQSTAKTVTVYNKLDGGKIAFNGTSKNISMCNGGDPANIQGSLTANAIAPSGGNASWSYAWQYSDSCNGVWNTIPATNTLAYDPPAGLTKNRCYRRVATNGCGIVISDTVWASIYRSPKVDMDLKKVCAGNTVNLTPTDTLYGSASTFNSYQITGADVTPVSNNGTYAPAFTSNAQGSYVYTYTITDANSCAASDTFSVKVYSNPAITINPAAPESCAGDSITLNPTVSGGNSPYTYLWTGNDTAYLNNPHILTPVFTANTPNPYNVSLTVTDNYGCKKIQAATITVNTNPQVSIAPSNQTTVCAGQLLHITSTINNNTGSVNYSWSGQTGGLTSTSISNPDYSNNNNGNYSLILWASDAKNCKDSASLQIKIDSLPLISSINHTDVSYCGMNDGSIAITASGSGTIQYSIDGGTTFNNQNLFNGLANATYQVIVKDVTGCNSSQQAVNINNGGAPGKPTITSVNQTICEGSATPTFSATGTGLGQLSWYTNFPGSVIDTGNTFTPTNPINGTNNYYVIENVNNCNSDTSKITLTILAAPANPVFTDNDTSICQGSPLTINASYLPLNVTYAVYDNPSLNPPSIGNLNYTIPSVNHSDTLYIQAEQVYGGQTCKAISSPSVFYITMLPKPGKPIITTNNQTICEGTSNFTLTANGTTGSSFGWYINFPGTAIFTGDLYSPSTGTVGTNTFYVQANINNCLSDTSTAVFTVLAAPQNPVLTDNDTSICEGSLLTISATPPPNNVVYTVYANASLTPPAIGSLNYTIPYVSQSETLYIQAEQNYGTQTCKAISTPVSYQITMLAAPNHPTITASNSTICQGNQTTISATPAGNSYQLYTSANQLIGNLSASVSPAISTWYYIITSGANGCKALGAKDSILITVNPAPAMPHLTTANHTICVGDSSFITVQPQVVGETYPLYQLPGNSLIGNTPIFIKPSATTTYIAEAISANGCRNLGDYDTLTITVNPLPVMPAITAQPNNTVCQGTSVTLVSSSLQNGEYVLLYDQLIGGNMLDTLSYTFIANATATYYAEIKNQNGCKNSGGKQPITVTVNNLPSKPIITSGDDAICEQTQTTITASTTPAGSVINWYDGNSISSTLLATGNTYTTPVLTANTTYYLQSASPQGCVNSGGYTPATIVVKPRPIVTLTNDAVNGFAYQGQIITFIAEPYGYPTYVFYVNSNQVQHSSANTYQTNTLNNYDVVAVTAIENGCESINKSELKIEIKPLSNAFTPNNDGTNDVFLKGLDLTILNRWGQQLYKGKDGWDGTYQGKIVSPGTYFYVVTLKDLTGNETTLNGPVTLISE